MKDTIRIAAYCRVSTDKNDQANSLENQKCFFENFIKKSQHYLLYKIYADDGVTGTSVKRRLEFGKMLKDAAAGKFDTVLTKEISRFARNTLDSIKYTRFLKDIGVNVIFLNDGIDTNDADSELRLAILSSIAQEESRKTSERVKWGQRIMMERGVAFGHSLFGYSLNEGVLSINESEANVVKKIFDMYVCENMSVRKISDKLKENRVAVSKYMKSWSPTAVLRILKNEKYCGDLVQLKTITTDYLSHKRIRNTGEMITIANHHLPIIDKKTFITAQKILAKNSKMCKKPNIDTSVPTSVSKPLSSE